MRLRIAWRNLTRGWRRSVIAIAAIAFGLGAAIFVVGLVKGMAAQMIDTAVGTSLAHVAVQARGYHRDPDLRRSLPDGGRAVLGAVRSQPGLAASPRLVGDGVVQSARQAVRAVILGVDPENEVRISTVPASVVEGTFLDGPPRTPLGRELAPIVLGSKMAERLNAHIGQKVVVHAPGESGLAAFRVQGIYRTASSEFDGSHAFLRLAEAQRLFGAEDRVTEVAVLLERPGEARALQTWLRRHLGGDVEVLRWDERAPRLAAMVQFMGQVSWIFYAGIFVAMAFGIANVLFMAVYERIREFGIMRALGLRPGGLLAMVLLESFLLTLVGTGAGIGAGFALVAGFSERGLDLAWFSEGLRAFGVGTAVRPRVDVGEVLSPVGIAAVTALVSGLFPALRAARLRPADAIRAV